MKFKSVIYFFYFFSIPFYNAQEFNTKKLDSFFFALSKHHKFMGSVGISKNGKTIYHKQIGFLDIKNNIKPNKETKYRIGSISKTFTAALILKAVEEKKLTLTETIANYFPTVKNADSITIENLLNHRSGIFNFTNHYSYRTYYTIPTSRKKLISIISSFDNNFKPNTKYEYSNSNYLLLSYILEDIYKRKYADILNDKICEPLELKNTYLGKKTNSNNNEAFSYNYVNKKWVKENETDTSIPLGAGGIVSTTEDLTKFINALFNFKLISEESIKRMTTFQNKYGYGITKFPFYDKAVFGHGGSIDGFKSMLGFLPSENVSFSILSNGLNYRLNSITLAMLKTTFNKDFNIPSFKTYNYTTTELDEYVGIYSSKNFSLKIKITKNLSTLKAQATGQSAFTLEALKKHVFVFNPSGIEMTFKPNENKMHFKQNGKRFIFIKE
jgi:CubicO group peptidase (beta-lactamase class C family)